MKKNLNKKSQKNHNKNKRNLDKRRSTRILLEVRQSRTMNSFIDRPSVSKISIHKILVFVTFFLAVPPHIIEQTLHLISYIRDSSLAFLIKDALFPHNSSRRQLIAHLFKRHHMIFFVHLEIVLLDAILLSVTGHLHTLDGRDGVLRLDSLGRNVLHQGEGT